MTALYRVDFEVSNNEDFRYAFQLADEAGVPVNLAGAQFRMDVEDRAGADVFSFSTANGRIIIDAAAGRIDLIAPVIEIAILRENYHTQDMLMTMSGQTTRLWVGGFTIIQGVTE